jgi:hypothetical protein
VVVVVVVADIDIVVDIGCGAVSALVARRRRDLLLPIFWVEVVDDATGSEEERVERVEE